MNILDHVVNFSLNCFNFRHAAFSFALIKSTVCVPVGSTALGGAPNILVWCVVGPCGALW